MYVGTVPDGHQYHACFRCGEPNSGEYLLSHHWYSFHESGRLANDPACPDCTELYKAERGRSMLIQKAPILMGPPKLNAPPVRDCDYWKHGHRDWLEATEHERYLDDLEWDAQRHG